MRIKCVKGRALLGLTDFETLKLCAIKALGISAHSLVAALAHMQRNAVTDPAAKAALDEAVKRGNEILRKFEASNKE